MPRLRGPELQALLDFLREIHGADDLEALRQRLPGAIATVVRADVTAYFEIDRRQRRLSITPHPGGALGASDEQAFARHMHQSPLFRSYRRAKGSAVKISDFLSLRQFQRLAPYNQLFPRAGPHHPIAQG